MSFIPIEKSSKYRDARATILGAMNSGDYDIDSVVTTVREYSNHGLSRIMVEGLITEVIYFHNQGPGKVTVAHDLSDNTDFTRDMPDGMHRIDVATNADYKKWNLVESRRIALCSENQKWFVAELRFKKNAFPGMRKSRILWTMPGSEIAEHARFMHYSLELMIEINFFRNIVWKEGTSDPCSILFQELEHFILTDVMFHKEVADGTISKDGIREALRNNMPELIQVSRTASYRISLNTWDLMDLLNDILDKEWGAPGHYQNIKESLMATSRRISTGIVEASVNSDRNRNQQSKPRESEGQDQPTYSNGGVTTGMSWLREH